MRFTALDLGEYLRNGIIEKAEYETAKDYMSAMARHNVYLYTRKAEDLSADIMYATFEGCELTYVAFYADNNSVLSAIRDLYNATLLDD